MIVKLENDLTLQEIEVLIKYASMNDVIKSIVTLLKSADTRIKCSLDGSEKLINACDIYYIESVDKRTFVYCKRDVYKTEFRLYQLLDTLTEMGFVQINKACILNINALDSVKSLPNSRMEAKLKNGERLYITRRYLDQIKQVLQNGGQL